MVPVAAVVSMTGFGRAVGGVDGLGWAWEARSVNARALDVRARLPASLEGQDQRVRRLVGAVCQRGTVTVGFSLDQPAGVAGLQVNEAMLDRLLALQTRLAGRVDPTPPRLEALLGLRGMLVSDDAAATPTDLPIEALFETLEGALAAMAADRAAEGGRLRDIMIGHLATIERLVGLARVAAAAQPGRLAERLKRQVAELLGGADRLSPERLAQEIALIATRADATEEIDRLTGHVAAARDLLAAGGPIGRRLDFLAQEFMREANTMTAKSGDLDVTAIGLDLKGAVEQFREQVQNIE